MHRRLPPLLLCGAVIGGLFGSALAGAAAPSQASDVVEAPPVLVDTESGGRKTWDDLAQLARDAEGGDPEAQFAYAQLLETGGHVAADPARALQLYRQAAEAKHGEALFRLGKIHHDGLLGVKTDYRAALGFYQRAAVAGVPEAMYNLGAMLVSARGVRRDYVEGLAWLLVAAEKGAAAEAGVAQVRQRLARRPEQIAAAERRAEVLKRQLQEDGAALEVPGATAKTPPVKEALTGPVPTLPVRSKVEVERPATARPTPPGVAIEQPTITIPATPPPPSEAAPDS